MLREVVAELRIVRIWRAFCINESTSEGLLIFQRTRRIKRQTLDVHEQLDERFRIRAKYIRANGDCLRNTGSVSVRKNENDARRTDQPRTFHGLDPQLPIIRPIRIPEHIQQRHNRRIVLTNQSASSFNNPLPYQGHLVTFEKVTSLACATALARSAGQAPDHPWGSVTWGDARRSDKDKAIACPSRRLRRS